MNFAYECTRISELIRPFFNAFMSFLIGKIFQKTVIYPYSLQSQFFTELSFSSFVKIIWDEYHSLVNLHSTFYSQGFKKKSWSNTVCTVHCIARFWGRKIWSEKLLNFDGKLVDNICDLMRKMLRESNDWTIAVIVSIFKGNCSECKCKHSVHSVFLLSV